MSVEENGNGDVHNKKRHQKSNWLCDALLRT